VATSSSFPLVAVDVGNSRIKLGEFTHPLADPLPHPTRTLALGLDWTPSDFDGWLPQDSTEYSWCISSVNRPAATRFLEWLKSHGVSRVHLLASTDLPIEVALPLPDKVGLDRLANAVAVNRLRQANEPAIVVSHGTAITVDLVDRRGAFMGGAIMPGLGISARALHEFTDLLPLVEVSEAPPALGKSTLAAMHSGLFWGALGGVRELVARLSEGTGSPQIFLTGGGAPAFASVLAEENERPPQFVPHLTLAGIAISALPHGPAKEAR